MSAFWVLTRLRMLEIFRRTSSALIFFALPPVMLIVVGAVFQNGHPFEQRRVALVGEGCPSFEGPDVLLSHVAYEQVGIAGLRTHVINAVVECESKRVTVEPRDLRFGEALARGFTAHHPANLTVIESDRYGYVRYIFSGLVAYSVLLAGLYGMGYTMVRYRQARFLKKLATTPLSPSVFVGSQIAARSLLVLMQIAVLLIAAIFIIHLRLTLLQSCGFLGVVLIGLWASMAIGFFLSSLVDNADTFGDAVNAAGIPLVFLSEVFFPLDVMPALVAKAAAYLPSTLLVRLLREVATEGTVDVLQLLGLVVWALALSILARITFRWEQ